MPKAFSESERTKIRAQLVEAGLKHFVRAGVRGVRIDDICADVSIAKGSFYAFFKNKEDLFMTIADERDVMHKTEMMALLLADNGSPAEVLDHFFEFMMERAETDPVLKIVRDTGEITHLIRRVPMERLAENERRDREFMAEVSDLFQKRHGISAATRQNMEGLLSIMLSVVLQQEHFQRAGSYEPTRELLRSMFVTHLMKGQTHHD